MTKAKAFYDFFSGFGMPAYVSTSVPADATFPRLTYDPVYGSLDGGPVSITVNLWFRTESEKKANDKADEIFKYIGKGGRQITCDDGMIWINRDSNTYQPMSDPDDSMIKRRYMLLTAQFLTID